MDLVSEYKSEVRLMNLSAEFKDRLKTICAASMTDKKADLSLKSDSDRTIDISQKKDEQTYKSKIKIYKYVSLAACLVAALSTIGIVSIMSGNIKYRSSDSDNGLGGDNAMYSEDATQEDVTSGSDSGGENEVNANLMPENSADTTGDEADSIIAPEEIPESDAEDDFLSAPDMVADALPESMLSSYVGYNYDGDYYTEDYVLMLSGSDASIEANVYSDYDEFASNAAAAPDAVTRNAPSSALNFYDLLDTKFADEAQRGGVSLVRMTVQGILDDDTLPALEDGMYTLYDVNIEYDYLNTQACDVDAYVWIKGTAENQLEGMPVYDVGDTILTSLYVTESGSVTVIDELLYDVYTLNDLMMGYHRVYEDINPGYTDMGILDSETEFVTTTSNNPVEYVHKSATSELTRYIRRKLNEYEYPYADLETLGMVSRGEILPVISEQTDDEQPVDVEDPTVTDDTGDEVPEEERLESLTARVSEEYMIVTIGGEQVRLNDEASGEYVASKYKNSATGSLSSTSVSNVMFVGGLLVFDTPYAFQGSIIEIEVSSAGCPLDLSFNGVKVGDSLDYVLSTLGIDESLADNSALTFTDGTTRAELTFEYGVLSQISVSLA